MSDLTNFYSLLPKNKDKLPAGFKNHLIERNSRILLIGASGTGKSNALMNKKYYKFNYLLQDHPERLRWLYE